MISQNTIQQILVKIDIIDVIGEFIALKKRGANYLGLCPFHNEKTPSFTVSPAKEIYKCFGCGRSGNTISFIMEHEKYGYTEAIKWLGGRYGVEVEESFASEEQKQQFLTSDSLFIINQFARLFYTEQLWNTEEGKNIGMAYLKERGFRENVIQKFQIGYAPEKTNAFTTEAVEKKYDKELLLKTGLVIQKPDQLVDNYRGRIIFPVHNQSGKILGFGARILRKDTHAPKYINTPENEIYVKSKILYGAYFARQAIDKANECLLVEGYTDVIAMHQAGIENVVASGGTSLTEDQLRLIKKYTNNLTIIYDGDAAGVKAALRGLELALENALNVSLVLLPENEDPDSYVHKAGTTAFEEYIQKNKKDFVLFQLDIALKEAGKDPTKKTAVVNHIAETISKINKVEEFVKQQDYIKKCAEILQVDEAGFQHLVNKFIGNKITALEKKAEKQAGLNLPPENGEPPLQNTSDSFTEESFSLLYNDELYEKELARILIEFGNKKWDEEKLIAQYIIEEMPDESLIENAIIHQIIQLFKSSLTEDKKALDKNFFIYHSDIGMSSMAVSVLNFPYEQSVHWINDFDITSGYQSRLFTKKFEEFAAIIAAENEGKLKQYLKTQEDNTRHQVDSALSFIKLRKIKQMILQNLADIEKAGNHNSIGLLLKTHEHLKAAEKQLTEKLGTVIIK